jgi:hypothetical protein
MSTQTSPASTNPNPTTTEPSSIGGPVRVAWREGTLTRAKELEALCEWVMAEDSRKTDESRQNDKILADAIRIHLGAAREAAKRAKLDPSKWFRIPRGGPLIERAKSNLDAAEALLLNIAPAGYVLGQMPCLLRHVRCHLPPGDPARQEFERIAQRLGIKDPDHALLQKTPMIKGPKRPLIRKVLGIKNPDHPLLQNAKDQDLAEQKRIVEAERGKIVTTVRAASSAGLREQIRLRSFRNVVIVTAGLMTVLAIGVALTGFFWRTLVPLCFAPEEAGLTTVVCPTEQSKPFIPEGQPIPEGQQQQGDGGQQQGDLEVEDIDDVIERTAKPADLMVVELVGLTAAAIAATAAIRRIKGSSERYGLPVALAVLKLPTGAITAFLGLLLMRGQFVPGLTALDTSAQILAWALVFGYAQQLFTRFVDQQGQTVLDNIRSADQPPPSVPAP